MKYAVDTAHREFFKKNLKLEFEAFFKPDEISRLESEIKKILPSGSEEQLYQAGRDVWRKSPFLRKFVTQSKLADIAADLTNEKLVRLGFDQYLPLPPRHLEKLPAENRYMQLLKWQEATLGNSSPIEGILCGVVIPLKEGNVVYITPAAPLGLAAMQCEALLIVYARAHSSYILQDKDPNAHALKHLGLGFGDLLTNKLHPMVKR